MLEFSTARAPSLQMDPTVWAAFSHTALRIASTHAGQPPHWHTHTRTDKWTNYYGLHIFGRLVSVWLCCDLVTFWWFDLTGQSPPLFQYIFNVFDTLLCMPIWCTMHQLEGINKQLTDTLSAHSSIHVIQSSILVNTTIICICGRYSIRRVTSCSTETATVLSRGCQVKKTFYHRII